MDDYQWLFGFAGGCNCRFAAFCSLSESGFLEIQDVGLIFVCSWSHI